MSDQNIFQGTQPTGAPAGGDATPQPGSSAQPFADLLGSIKNERGEPKYKDVQTALEALRHSQEYIPTLKQEKEATDAKLAALAAEVERLKNIEQSVAQLTQQQQAQRDTPAAGVTEDAVANLVNQTLTQREIAAKKTANVSSVVAALTQKLGAEADKEFYKKAEELGMTAEQMNNLAAQSPTAVLKLFGLEGTKPQSIPSGSPVQSSVNTAGLQPQQHSYVGRNQTSINVGATTQDLMEETQNSKKLVEELHNQGLSTYDLTDPKIYKKYFGVKKG
jgi:hypothetical protein